MTSIINTRKWGSVDNRPVFLYSLTNSNGMRAEVTNYGATIVSLTAPDKKGLYQDILLGFDNLAAYVAPSNTCYHGASIGRFGNRIAKGQFSLDGVTYQLPLNDGPNSLHGGLKGFDKVVWAGEQSTSPDGASAIAFTYVSKDGEEGYPGQLTVKIVFTLLETNAFQIDYFASTDKKTIINLTNHSYFNLAEAGADTVLNHRLTIDADKYLPVDETAIPYGSIDPVAGTPFDFRTPHVIGERINADDVQIKNGGGYDHNFILNHRNTGAPEFAARVEEPVSGRVMEVFTTEPGIQFYSANFFTGEDLGKNDKKYKYRSALALETQHYPDAPNQPEFPTTVLEPGQNYHETTIYSFSTL
jgi:aldose 1-epimerase